MLIRTESNLLLIHGIFIRTGKEEREREKLRADLVKRGNQLRAELSAKGKALKADQQNRLEELKKAITEAQALKDDRENIKRDAETMEKAALDIYQAELEKERAVRNAAAASENVKEAQETFIRFDSNGDGILELAELQTRVQFDKNRDGAVDVEEAHFFLDNNDQVNLDTFIAVAWPRVKPYLMLDAGLFKPPASVEELNAAEQQAPEEAELYNENDDGQQDPVDPAQDVEELEEEPEYEEDETGEGEVSISRLHIVMTVRSV